MSYTPQLFSISDDINWKEYLDKYGFVVINNVLDEETYTDLFAQFYLNWSNVATKFDFHDKTTWTPENCPMMWDIGMITGYGLAHARFQWELRTNPNVLDIWKRLHGTDELVVSFDGFSVFLTPEQKTSMWLHIDQNPKDPLYSIQGAYNFMPVGEEDAGFVVVPGSHRTFFVDVDEKHKFIPVNPYDIHVDYAVKLLIPSNCFVLWNSKTLHANSGMSASKTPELNRVTSYICYFPKEQRPGNILMRRVNGYHRAVNCGHYAIDYNVKQKPYGSMEELEAQGFNLTKPIYDQEGNIPSDIYDLI